jgi:hypothetical protein
MGTYEQPNMLTKCPHCDHPITDIMLRKMWARRNSASIIKRSGGRNGGRKPKPTACPKCHEMQPSAISARKHCQSPAAR